MIVLVMGLRFGQCLFIERGFYVESMLGVVIVG